MNAISTYKSSRGMTLIEILIVISIIAILASVAIPAYQDSVRKGKRSDGIDTLLKIDGLQGRYLYQKGTYTADLTKLGFASASAISSSDGYYKVSVLTTATCPIASCYALRATPQAGQVDDGIMELNSLGSKRRDKNKDGDTADAGEDSW